MDSRVNLLKEFYSNLQKDKAKLETYRYGFEFLEEMAAGGVTLEYGELTLSGLLHKYKLMNIPEHRLDELLQAHIMKTCNLCLYFDEAANNTFCLNLDNNYKTNNTILIPEMKFTVRVLREHLGELGIEPLVIASGRGYHLWCRFDVAIHNDRLYGFMLRLAAKSMATLHENGYDYNKIKFNLYPDLRILNVVSLRLFGSVHAKNKIFSYIHTPEGLLDEAASWEYFEYYMKNKTITEQQFAKAYDAIMAEF
jgi:hypothetical protein